MLDKPFKTNPHYSVGLGIGFGSSNMFFKNTFVNLKANSSTLPFTRVDSSDHFNKFKLVTTTLEIPVELRYFSDPEHPGKSWKAAAGVKVGTLLKTLYIDSALKKSEKLDKENNQCVIEEAPREAVKISWKQFKKLQS